jgi:hypothetical protein
MFKSRRAVLPEKPFPLVLRAEWRCDLPNPRLGRLRALALAARQKTARPVLRRFA